MTFYFSASSLPSASNSFGYFRTFFLIKSKGLHLFQKWFASIFQINYLKPTQTKSNWMFCFWQFYYRSPFILITLSFLFLFHSDCRIIPLFLLLNTCVDIILFQWLLLLLLVLLLYFLHCTETSYQVNKKFSLITSIFFSLQPAIKKKVYSVIFIAFLNFFLW